MFKSQPVNTAVVPPRLQWRLFATGCVACHSSYTCSCTNARHKNICKCWDQPMYPLCHIVAVFRNGELLCWKKSKQSVWKNNILNPSRVTVRERLVNNLKIKHNPQSFQSWSHTRNSSRPIWQGINWKIFQGINYPRHKFKETSFLEITVISYLKWFIRSPHWVICFHI